MKVKLLKRIRKDYRIVCDEVYITTKNGERITEKRYSAEYWGVANGFKGWHQNGTWHYDMEYPLEHVHRWMKQELRKYVHIETIVWP